MKTLINIILSLLVLASFLWVVTQGNTSDAGKIIRLLSLLATSCLFLNYSSWGRKLINHES